MCSSNKQFGSIFRTKKAHANMKGNEKSTSTGYQKDELNIRN